MFADRGLHELRGLIWSLGGRGVHARFQVRMSGHSEQAKVDYEIIKQDES